MKGPKKEVNRVDANIKFFALSGVAILVIFSTLALAITYLS